MMHPAQRVLRGLTWDHTRGWAPLAVTAQVFADHRPGVRIDWDRRSLWAFGEQGLDSVAGAYDLVIVDHPMVGSMARSGLFLPFEPVDCPPAVGPSAQSYLWDGRLWALPVDAACQVSVGRADLLAAAGEARPLTWDDVLSLAERTGRVRLPLTPIDVFSSLLTLCAGAGAPAGAAPDGSFLDRAAALESLHLLRRLRRAVPDSCLGTNPIAVLEQLGHGDEAWFCPLVFGYSNYSRDGYAPHRLQFGDIPRQSGRRGSGIAPGGALLGGAGIAVTAGGSDPGLAAEYARWVSSDPVQQGEFVRGGGQPAAVAAWEADEADRLTHGYFRATRATIEAATVRPRDPSFPGFQTRAAAVLHDWLVDAGAAPEVVLSEVEALYRRPGTPR